MDNSKLLAAFKVDESLNFSDITNKIIDTLSFRKLAGKTQVILSLHGPDVRTRLTHTMEVVKIARDLCDVIRLNNSLTEAIAIAHDLGHTPFGHVGERTLREIMCGCDTLKGKILDCDFYNSGFRHNLQSFRVINNLELLTRLDSSESDRWPFVLWGVAEHTKQSWANTRSGMDDEIMVSCEHCEWIFSCYFGDDHKCKRNSHIAIRIHNNNKVCKPWLCAVVNELCEVKPCNPICYFAKLWKFKQENKDKFWTYPYFADHPFPNSFYLNQFFNYFENAENHTHNFFSFEAHIVKQADEIAQRKQDLEDALEKNLITKEEAVFQVLDLLKGTFEYVNANFGRLSSKPLKSVIRETISHLSKAYHIDGASKLFLSKFKKKSAKDFITINPVKNSRVNIGNLLVEFYKKILIEYFNMNFSNYVSKTPKPPYAFRYCIAKIVSEIQNCSNKTELKNDLRILKESFLIVEHIDNLNDFFIFSTNENPNELMALLYFDILNNYAKIDSYDFPALKTLVDVCNKIEDNNQISQTKETKENYIITLDKIEARLKKRKAFYEFINPKDKDSHWINSGHLNFFQFFILCKFSMDYNFDKAQAKKEYNNFLDTANVQPFDTITKLKSTLKRHYNGLISDFFDIRSIKAIKDFSSEQFNTILKSEIVEKNDGKARFILRQLFKAYITNSHQLPNNSLLHVLHMITERLEELRSEHYKKTCEILNEFKSTCPGGNLDIPSGSSTSCLESLYIVLEDSKGNSLSNEVKDILNKRKILVAFFDTLLINKDDDIAKIRKFRGILDNPILNALDSWNSILTRGICDHIACLTDQEAIDEYEKLYTGTMELI
ncbi:MAG: HD domain-containing protein [Candidatus Wallbacteria bacterium]|nr:HD domain-containing protein [Candidatus Wallbacteria bacterium]